MKINVPHGLGLAGILMLCSSATLANPDYTVSYHETIDDLQVTQVASAGGDDTRKVLITMFAFDQELVLELESYDDLISSIDIDSGGSLATTLLKSGEFEVLRGKILGKDDSWVRLTRSGSFYTGVIWDGKQLLAIEPYSTLTDMLTNSSADDTDHIIYSTDQMIPMKGQSCAVDDGGSAFDGLVQELQAKEQLAASSQLDIAFVTDRAFAVANQGEVDTAVISRLNVLDGIFSEQVGVKINAKSIRRVGDNPELSSTNASTLLGQLRDFGNEKLANPGLVHLFTGRDLDNSIVGTAYLNVLCSRNFGYGLTQASGGISAVRSALIAAHELGHNFGSPHDNQSGSACANTAGNFLMNPSINGSDTFSQCSLGIMAPAVENAACLVPVEADDPGPEPGPGPGPSPGPEPQPAPGSVIFAAGFNKDSTQRFVFRGNPWGFGNRPKYQSARLRSKGGVTGGALSILLGGVDGKRVNNMSGGFERTFDLPVTANLKISFEAVLRQSSNYESNETSALYASFNGEFLRVNDNDALAMIKGNGNGGKTRSTGFKTYEFELNDVPAGQHVLTIGGFNNRKDGVSERTEIRIDNVKVKTRGSNVLAAVDTNDSKRKRPNFSPLARQ